MRNRLVKLFALLVVLGLALALSPVLLAQTALTPKPTAQMHDVAGVWNAAPPAQRPAGTPAPPPPPPGQQGSLVAPDVKMTPWAQARFVQDGINSTADPYRQCEPLGPTRWTQYVHPFEILQTPDRIFFFYEIDHLWRIVYMDGRAVPKVEDLAFGPTYMGYSVGHWDGDDLVVDTVGVTDKTWIDIVGHPHSDNMHLTERYHRVDHDTLELSFTFNDPEAYSKPWVYGPKRYALKTGPQWEIQESECLLSDEKRFEQNVSDDLNGLTQK
jgi:hypothetical protein